MKTDRNNPSLVDLERSLAQTLVPVEPRPEYVYRLKRRLIESDAEMKMAPSLFRILVYGAAGLVSLLLLIIAGVRGKPRLVGALQHIHRPVAAETPAPLSPAM